MIAARNVFALVDIRVSGPWREWKSAAALAANAPYHEAVSGGEPSECPILPPILQMAPAIALFSMRRIFGVTPIF
jgi:hypothetical protein